jgi:hypothetical protein
MRKYRYCLDLYPWYVDTVPTLYLQDKRTSVWIFTFKKLKLELVIY